MSLRVIKAGILDTIQDSGRYGYQHLGINPGGAMDLFAAEAVNILVGNSVDEAMIEIHFPSAAFLFEQGTIIALGGADFSPTINGEAISLWQPVIINKNSVLQFSKLKSGARCYLAIKDGLNIPPWLNSYSTNLKAAAGGFSGRALQKDDIISFKKENNYTRFLSGSDVIVLPWQADINWNPSIINKISFVPGNEWGWLDEQSQNDLLTNSFTITTASDRMGYRLNGTPLTSNNKTELISSAVSFGTIQLLPDGQLITLMADHQTTGGYPRVAHVITAHLSKLAQMWSGEKINFSLTDIKTAEDLLILQKQHLQQLQKACTFRLEKYFTR